MGIQSNGSLSKGVILFVAIAAIVAVAAAEERTWTDATGKFKLSAELVEVKDGKAVLLRSDGKTVSVPVTRLSDVDRAFIEAHDKEQVAVDPGTGSAGSVITDIASRFYGDLRSTERATAKQMLTKVAEALMSSGKSPLAGLPQPETGAKAIMPGSAKVEGDVAEIPVMVRAGGHVHKTKLHLRKEGDDWRVLRLARPIRTAKSQSTSKSPTRRKAATRCKPWSVNPSNWKATRSKASQLKCRNTREKSYSSISGQPGAAPAARKSPTSKQIGIRTTTLGLTLLRSASTGI